MKLPLSHIQPTDLPITCVTIDVEEYFQASAANAAIPRDRWLDWPSRVERCVVTALDILERTGARATFFFLAHTAKENPKLAPRCLAAGHEIASHGAMHDPLTGLDPAVFRKDIHASRKLLEDQVGQKVLGYRAPSWSLTHRTQWAVDAVRETGFAYDASIVPTADALAWPHYIQREPDDPPLLEVPPLVHRKSTPHYAAGGRTFGPPDPGATDKAIAQALDEGRPVVLCFDIWEFDTDLPRLPLSMKQRSAMNKGVEKTADRLETVINRGGLWRPIRHHLDMLQRKAAQTGVLTLQPAATA